MNKSIIFKTAHAITKATLKRTVKKYDYRTTFSASLKLAIEQAKYKALVFSFRDVLGFNFTKTKSGKKVIKVEVGSFAWNMFKTTDISVEINNPRGGHSFVEVAGFGKEFEELEDAVRQTGVKYQYVYFNEASA